MNPKLQCIFSRRSIRQYTSKEIPESLVTDLLEAAMAAPSAVARDPWHFIVLAERKNIDTLAAALPNGQMLKEAPMAIVICGDLSRAHDQQLSYLLQDISAAVENMLLAANILGLGACWLGIHPRQERITTLTAQLKLPENVLPIAAVSLGWPGQEREARTRFNPAAVHREQW